ncbi:hypothetical protein [Parasulfitobacter algicola]|uniref:Rhodanese domain-containing protein n=1 Tax=Parasulfitobacter algicola TaxID=2614809 RepID=A0ABX2IV37_9RHOB|nr:hypothetical protein [Sulfitobacter algicola]NSX56400.1 hypothetical protein [Sulfitobacter algicola]
MHHDFLKTGITPTALFNWLGTVRTPRIIDVCIDEDFAAAPFLIPTAERQAFTNISSPEPTVVICQKGLKLSQGAAAMLRSTGRVATFLIGGNIAWRMAGLARIAADKVQSNTLWLTSDTCFAHRAFQFWILRRWVSRSARLLCVDKDQVNLISEKFAACILPDNLTAYFDLDIPVLQSLEKKVKTKHQDLWTVLSGIEQTSHSELAGFDAAALVLDAAYVGYRSC